MDPTFFHLIYTSWVGGLFSILVFWHFLSDWVFQSEREALAKSKNWRVRFRHVSVYTALFLPLFWWMGFWDLRALASCAILWVSHFIIDTYWPVMMWAKYLRRAKQFQYVVTLAERIAPTPKQRLRLMKLRKSWEDKVIDPIVYDSDKAAFEAFFMTPIGAILCITIDQLCHIACLIPVAWLMMP